MWPLLLLAICATTRGQTTSSPACVHNNVEQISADKVIVMFLADLDINKDGILSVGEVFTEMLSKFDPNKDSSISKDEFVTQWHAKFRDVPEFAEYLFMHFDQDCDDMISYTDAPNLIALMDLDHDQQVTEIEYAEYMSDLYYACVPHSHRQNCNFG